MSLNNLPDELVLEILEYISSNKDMISLRLSCKYFKNVGDKVGFIKNINIGMHTDMMNYIHLHGKHYKMISNLIINNINRPCLWIPSRWPKNVTFSYCYMSRIIDPPVYSITENLTIIEPTYVKRTLKINWNKFSNLKYLYVDVFDLDFEGIDYCKKLKDIYINLHNIHREVPSLISKFSELENIIICCKSVEEKLHFISNKLKVCIINKNSKFTTNSKILPKKHLEKSNDYINIAALLALQ